jgi:ABC-type polysaccharide/polyol phosphate export permease
MAGEALIDRAAEVDTFRRTLGAMFRYRELLKNLVAKDLKLKYRGSVLGFLWSLLNPLLMIAVYSVAFGYILRVQTDVFYLLLGILAWTFFVNSVMMSTGAIIDNAGLVKSVFFPRAILPVATVLFNFAQFLLTAVVFIPVMMLIKRVAPSWPVLALPLILGLQLLFTIGIGLLIATGTAFFRDFRHFLEIALSALFWLTPIVWRFDQVSESVRPWLRLSPMAPFVMAYQQMFTQNRWPDGTTWLLATIYTVAAVALGMRVILRHEDQFSEQL